MQPRSPRQGDPSAKPSAPSSDSSFSWNTTLEQSLVEMTIRRPEGDAVVATSGTLSYADLLIRAQNIAVALRYAGVTPGDLVGMTMDQSLGMVASIAGVLLTGAAYVPLTRDLLEDAASLRKIRGSGMTTILCDRSWEAPICHLWSDVGKVIDTSRVEQQTMPPSTQTGMPKIAAEATATVLFRRRAAGDARGVMVPHRAIQRLVQSKKLLRYSAAETFLLYPSAGGRHPLLELWGALLHGARVILAPDAPLENSRLQELVRHYGVTTLCLPVAMFHRLAAESPDIFATLQQLVIEDDNEDGRLSPLRLEWLMRAFSNLRVVHCFGMAETTGYATSYLVPADYRARASVPIGIPLEGIDVSLVDSGHQAVGDGEIGDLVFSGIGVASGYLRDPDLTAKCFTQKGGGAYSAFLTGERARWRADQMLELHGPVQRLVAHPKKAGLEYSLADIEAMLAGQAGVRDAAVVRLTDERQKTRTVAFVEVEPHSRDAAGRLEGTLRRALGEAALPCIRYVDQIPRNDAGFLDQAALQRRWKKESEPVPQDELLRRDALEQVRLIWERLLQQPSIGIDEDFIAAGGTQVQLIRMHFDLNRRWPGIFSMADLAALKTIRKIHNHLMERLLPSTKNYKRVGA